MAVYLVTKTNNAKQQTYICSTDNVSSTLSIPGVYIQISYSNTDGLYNMNSSLSVYNVIYFDSKEIKRNVYICDSSFDNVFNFCRGNLDVLNFVTINKTDYVWYNLR